MEGKDISRPAKVYTLVFPGASAELSRLESSRWVSKTYQKNWRNGLLAFSAICASSGSDYSGVTKNIYPERIECFNWIMLSGIRLCFPLWVAQMSLSSFFSWNNVSAYCLWHKPGSVLAFRITSLNMPASVSDICDHSMWHVLPH